MIKVFLDVPAPPSDNELFINTPDFLKKTGNFRGRLKTGKYRNFKKMVGIYLLNSKLPRDLDKTYRWEVKGNLLVPKGRHWKWDISNFYKAILDAIGKYTGCDDRYIIKFGPFEKILTNEIQGRMTLILKFYKKREMKIVK